MKHIRKFNEANLSDDDPSSILIGFTERRLKINDGIEKTIEEIESMSFILQDEGINPIITSEFGKEIIQITLATGKTTSTWAVNHDLPRENFVWDSIVNKDEYMEYIDRVKEICENNGYKIYVPHLNKPIYTGRCQLCLKYTLCRMVLAKEYPASEVFSDSNTSGSIFVPIDEAIEELMKVAPPVAKPTFIKKFKNLFK